MKINANDKIKNVAEAEYYSFDSYSLTRSLTLSKSD